MEKPDSKLKELIKRYTNEQKALEKTIAKSLREFEYLVAHHHQGRLQQVNRELQMLHSMLDPNFQKKQLIQFRIDAYKKTLRSTKEPALRAQYQTWIAESEAKLSRIETVVKQPNSTSLLVAQTLQDLVHKKYKKVTLVLDKEQQLALNISGSKVLRIQLPKLKTLLSKRAVTDYQLSLLQKLGFTLNQTQSTLTLIVKATELVPAAMQVLSQIVFHVFFVEDLLEKSYLIVD